jgi:hypothetical protein
MTDKLKTYLDELFDAVPNTREVREVKDELYDSMLERYEDCLKSGMDEQAAYDSVVDSIGDIHELIEELDTGEYESASSKKSSFDVNAFAKSVANFTTSFVSGVSSGISSILNDTALAEMRLVNTVCLPLENINNIDITYVADSVRIMYGDGENLVVNEYMNKNDAALFAKVSCENSNIDIVHGSRIEAILLRSKIEIILPRSYGGGLRVSTVSGRIQCDEEVNLSSLTLKTISAEIDFNYITAGMVRASSTSGSIHFGTATGEVDLKTISGSIRIDTIKGQGSFTSTSGGIRANFEELKGNIKAHTISGGIRLNVPDDVAVELDLKSTIGSIHTAFNNSLSYHKRNRVHAFVGNAPYNNIKISSTSGGIHIND